MLTLTALLLTAVPSAQRYVPPLQPRTYASESGAWSVHLDPTSHHGEGEGRYVATHADRTAWSDTLPFTFQDAVLDDSGWLAGYAYTHGLAGLDGEPGDLVVALVSPTGEVVWSDATERRPSRDLHAAPEPTVVGLVLDAGHERFLLRLPGRSFAWSVEEWRAHDLRTGRRIAAFVPAELAGRTADEAPRVVAVRALPGAALYACYGQRTRYDRDPAREDLVLDLIDLEGRPVASVVHPGELAALDTLEQWSVHEQILRHGLAPAGPGRLSVWLPDAGQRVAYELAERGDGRDLVEAGRAAWTPPPRKPGPPADAEPIELRRIAEVRLGSGPPRDAPFRRIHAYGFDARGRVLVVDDSDKAAGAVECVLLEPDGEVLARRRLELPETPYEARFRWWPFRSGRWLLTATWRDDGMEAHGRAWWASPDTGELRPLPHWTLSCVDGIAETADGGILASAATLDGSLLIFNLGCFDADGAARWLHSGPSVQLAPGERLGTGDVAVSPEGEIAVLDSGRKAIQFIGPDGTWRETVDLAAVWEDAPRYPACIETDSTGAFVLVDSNLERPVRRIDRDGAVLAALTPRRAGASPEGVLAHRVRVAPDGRCWTSDGHVLLRLGPDGAADRTLGPTATEDSLAAPGATRIDRLRGRVVIQDKIGRALHVFDAQGAQALVARPDPDDYAGKWHGDRLLIGPDGALYASTSALPGGWLAFDPTGARRGPAELERGTVGFAPGGRRWSSLMKGLRLHGPDGRELGTIQRRADGVWLSVADSDLGPDGSVAVLERPQPGSSPQTRCVSLYDPDGTPRVDVPLPGDAGRVWKVAHGGRWIVVHGYQAPAWLLDLHAGTWHRFEPPWVETVSEAGYVLGVSADGRELWAVDPVEGLLRRYALPGSG